ncbi:hypothetical protein Gohar_010064, partial [Gossypium harknessii]|nr:hypothetical protein [Gossypium harknessii]
EAIAGGFKSTLIRRIHQLLSKVFHWNIQHIPQNENKFADNLIKTARDKRKGLRLLEPPV